jgi:hypothetical protein
MQTLLKLTLATTILVTINTSASASLHSHQLASSDLSPYSNLSNPAFLPFTPGNTINVNYAKPYNIEGLYDYTLQGITSIQKISCSALVHRFGVKEYTEETIEFLAGYKFSDFLLAGYTQRFLKLSISHNNFQKNKYQQNGDFALLLKFSEFANLGVLQKNIYSYYDQSQQDLLPAERALGLNLKLAEGISLTYNFYQAYYGNISSYHISANLLPFFRLSAGYSHQTTTYGFSTEVIFKDININYTLLYHAYLGSTHTFALSWSSTSHEFEPMNYQRQYKRSKKIKKLDIQKCSLEDLKTIPDLELKIAKRLIIYRKIFGKITPKSLVQLGLPAKEVKTLDKYLTGLNQNLVQNSKNTNRKKPYQKHKIFRFNTQEKQRNLFELLLKEHFSYSKAFLAARLAKYKTIPSLLNALQKTKKFSQKELKKVKEICKRYM